MNLKQLTELVLSLNESPLTRIRLTKAIYFAHKELARKHLMNLDDISYIRLPLGPAPEGLASLVINHPSIITQDISSNLLYENQSYTLSAQQPQPEATSETISIIQKTLHALASYSTPELIQASQDPSWLAHANGEVYHLTSSDLKNPFPTNQIRFKIHIKATPNRNEMGAIQATLLRGMLADIVKESTDLEYPDQIPSNPSFDSTTDKDALKLRKFIIKLPSWPKKKDK